MTKSKGILRMDAKALAEKIGAALNSANISYTVCGALRRGISLFVPELEIIVSDLWTAWYHIHALWKPETSPLFNSKSGKKVVIIAPSPIPIKLFHAYPEEWGAMVLHHTGNHFFIIQMRSAAKKDGMKLNQYGLWFNENIIAGIDERQIFEALDLPFISPEDREFQNRQTLEEFIVRRR
jgi:DNA polymerase (family X)